MNDARDLHVPPDAAAGRTTVHGSELSRREFVALSVAAGLGGAAAAPAAAALPVKEEEVSIKTPDGTCDAVFIHPCV